MPPKKPGTRDKAPRTTRLRWPLLGLLGLVALVWIGFFDSHSLLRRVQWSQERAQLREDNRKLMQDIEQVAAELTGVPATGPGGRVSGDDIERYLDGRGWPEEIQARAIARAWNWRRQLERGEAWINRYGGKYSSEWFFSKALQILQEAPEVYNAADRLLEATDWVIWQMTGVPGATCRAASRAVSISA